jgi:Nuclease-related domain
MSKRGRRAGQNIRELELKRRTKAIYSFGSAVVVVSLPFILVRLFEPFLKPFNASVPPQKQLSLNLPPIYYILFLVLALLLVANGIYYWKRASHAAQGAKGEEDVSRELSQLEREGWKIEYGMRLGNGLGDADIVCISPRDKAYVIDVKSYKGEVMVDGEKLHRRMGKTKYPFEKDFVAHMMKQALQVRKQKGLTFVTPILAFSEAKVSVPSNSLRKVHIVEKSRLVSLLKSLG